MSIRSAREVAGLTQQDLADKLNIGRSTVAMWETGGIMPRVGTLKRLSIVLGCSTDELLKEELEGTKVCHIQKI